VFFLINSHKPKQQPHTKIRPIAICYFVNKAQVSFLSAVTAEGAPIVPRFSGADMCASLLSYSPRTLRCTSPLCCWSFPCIWMCVCVCLRVYAHECAYVRARVRGHVRGHVRVHVCVHVRVHVCVCACSGFCF